MKHENKEFLFLCFFFGFFWQSELDFVTPGYKQLEFHF